MSNIIELKNVNKIYTGAVDTQVLFVNFGEQEALHIFPILSKLRMSGIATELYPDSVKMKKQMIT